MRTEIKAGLVIGLIIIAGVVFYAVRQGGSGGSQVDKIPFDVKPGAGPGVGIVDVKAEKGREGKGTTPGKPASTPPQPGKTPPLAAAPGRTPERSTPQPTTPEVTRTLPPIVGPSGGPRTPPPGGTATTAPATPPALTRTVIVPEEIPGDATRPGLEAAQPPAAQPNITTPTSPQPTVALPPRPLAATQPTDTATRVKESPKPERTALRYTVQSGDTLSSIAREHYGDARYWTKIRDANKDIDPDWIKEGQVLVLPPKEEATGAGAAPAEKKQPPAAEDAQAKAKPVETRPAVGTTYVVQKGDTLIHIARTVLGDAARWREIYDLNKDKIKNPDHLLEGTPLKLPAKEKKEAAKEPKAKP